MSTVITAETGSPEWLAARSCYLCASEAAAMMGWDAKTTRNELLRLKTTGTEKEFSDYVRTHILDKGLEVEALARAIVEEEIGEDLYQQTFVDDEGRLLASPDGYTMNRKRGFEHKQWNKELAAAIEAGDLPRSHWPQVEQQIKVIGLESVIFVCSDGTREKRVLLEYRAVPGRMEQVLRGWDQFEQDMKTYRYVEDAPKPAATALMELPALAITLSGEVKGSNLPAYKKAALDFIAAINTNLQTDEDFVNAAATVKFCSEAEDRLDLVRQQALEQTVSIAELFRTIKQLHEAFTEKRLELNRLVESRKSAIREEQRKRGVDAVAAHIAGLNTRLGRSYMPQIQGKFGEVMKNLRTISSLRNAVDTEVARVKVEASEIADRIDINLKTLAAVEEKYSALFPDEAAIVMKSAEDLAALISVRKQEQDKRLQEQAERVRQQEAAKVAPPPQAPAPAQQQIAPEAPVPQTTASGTTKRPSDDDIVAALAPYYNTSPGRVIVWIRGMDLNAVLRRLGSKAAA